MAEDELESFMDSIVAAVDRQIMDKVCHSFSPTFFCRNFDGEVSVAVMDSYHDSEDKRKSDMASIARQAAKLGVKPTAVGIAAMFISEETTGEDQVIMMLVAIMTPDSRTRFALMIVETDEDGVLSIRDKFRIPEDKSYEIFEGLRGMLYCFYSTLESEDAD